MHPDAPATVNSLLVTIMPIYEGVITEKSLVVIDIGTAYTKLGFSGENAPRFIIKSEVRCKRSNVVRRIHEYKNPEDLNDLLVAFIHMLYYKYALVSPKDRPVVIVESLLCPTLFRETLACVLFKHFEVLSMLTLPSHLVALATLGVESALVVDVGYSEAVAIPICHGLPVLHAWQALPIAASAIHHNIKDLLSLSNMGVQNIDEDTLEDIKVRCCFVTTEERAEQLTAPKTELKPCPDVKYPYGGSKILQVSGALRETAHEVLYQEDNDHQCLSTMILDAIMLVNVDLRKMLAENILLIGGSCMVTGFKARLKEELCKQINLPRYEKLKIKMFKFHTAPAKENYTAWLGGALYGLTEIVGMKALTREQYFTENHVPDWANMKDNRTL